MSDQDQLTRHEREIAELRGKLESLATKEFVRSVVQDQTVEMNRRFDAFNAKFDAFNARFDAVNAKFDAVNNNLQALNERQFRIIGAADFLKSALPMIISIITLIVLILSLLSNG